LFLRFNFALYICTVIIHLTFGDIINFQKAVLLALLLLMATGLTSVALAGGDIRVKTNADDKKGSDFLKGN
jgi:hypothetical protein